MCRPPETVPVLPSSAASFFVVIVAAALYCGFARKNVGEPSIGGEVDVKLS